MKLFKLLSIFSLLFSLSANAYTRAELENLSKDSLIQLILDMQGSNGNARCTTFNPLAGETGSILTVLRNPGYNNNGTLRFPNGQVFMSRSAGYNNDYTLNYPNGQTMLLRNSGYNNDKTLYWSNGKTLRLVSLGYNNNGSIFHPNGDNWLLRNVGYSNDRQRFGAGADGISDSDFSTRAYLTTSDSVDVVTTLENPNWTVEITVHGDSNTVSVKECLR